MKNKSFRTRTKMKVAVPMVMLFCLWCAFTATQPSEQPEGTPLFITDIAPCKDGMIVSQKGIRKVTLYAPD